MAFFAFFFARAIPAPVVLAPYVLSASFLLVAALAGKTSMMSPVCVLLDSSELFLLTTLVATEVAIHLVVVTLKFGRTKLMQADSALHDLIESFLLVAALDATEAGINLVAVTLMFRWPTLEDFALLDGFGLGLLAHVVALFHLHNVVESAMQA